MVGGNFSARIQKYGGLGYGWASSCVSLWELLEAFPDLCSCSSHLESGTLFQCPCIWQSLFPASGCCFWLRKLDFSGEDFFRGGNAWYNSGCMPCVSTLVAMDELHTFSTLRRTRILKCCSPFSCRTEKRAQSMLLVAVLLCAVRTWKTGSASRASRG